MLLEVSGGSAELQHVTTGSRAMKKRLRPVCRYVLTIIVQAVVEVGITRGGNLWE